MLNYNTLPFKVINDLFPHHIVTMVLLSRDHSTIKYFNDYPPLIRWCICRYFLWYIWISVRPLIALFIYVNMCSLYFNGTQEHVFKLYGLIVHQLKVYIILWEIIQNFCYLYQVYKLFYYSYMGYEITSFFSPYVGILNDPS